MAGSVGLGFKQPGPVTLTDIPADERPSELPAVPSSVFAATPSLTFGKCPKVGEVFALSLTVRVRDESVVALSLTGWVSDESVVALSLTGWVSDEGVVALSLTGRVRDEFGVGILKKDE